MMLSHESLLSYYLENFQLMKHHNYSLRELDEMIPFERDIYLNLLQTYLEERKKELERQNA